MTIDLKCGNVDYYSITHCRLNNPSVVCSLSGATSLASTLIPPWKTKMKTNPYLAGEPCVAGCAVPSPLQALCWA